MLAWPAISAAVSMLPPAAMYAVIPDARKLWLQTSAGSMPTASHRRFTISKTLDGLDHYEGRSFVGWHHHVSVALVCYAPDSLISMRIVLAKAVLFRWLPRCPCCLRPQEPDDGDEAVPSAKAATTNWQQQC